MFRILDTEANLIVAKNARKANAITDAAKKYSGIVKTLTIQKLAPSGKYATVGTFATK